MKRKQLFRASLFIAIFLIVNQILCSLLTLVDPVSQLLMGGFYKEPKNTLDVVTVGASDLYTGYLPTNAWKEYKYTSYNYGLSSNSGDTYKHIVAEIEKRQSPKLILCEINGLIQSDEYYTDSKKHQLIDTIGFSRNKLDAIQDMVDKEKRMEYYLPLISYHNNWKHPDDIKKSLEVKKYLKENKGLNTKGWVTNTQINSTLDIDKQVELHFTDKSRAILKDMLEYCKNHEIKKILFVRFPHAYKIANPEVLDSMEQMIQSYGYDFLNLNDSYDAIGIDPHHDFYNGDHLNVYGMEKLTHYLGNYLCDTYHVQGEHSKKDIERWDRCSQKTDEEIENCKQYIEDGVHYWYDGMCYSISDI